MEDTKDKNFIIKDYSIKNDNTTYNLELIKYKTETKKYLTIKLFKKNSIYNYIYTKNITIDYFKTLSSFFQNINKIESIIEILLNIKSTNSITIKEKNYNSLTLILKYKKTDLKLILLKETANIMDKNFINNPNIIFKEIITKIVIHVVYQMCLKYILITIIIQY